MRQYRWNAHRHRHAWVETGGYSRGPAKATYHVEPQQEGPPDPAHGTPELRKAKLDAETARIIAEIRARNG